MAALNTTDFSLPATKGHNNPPSDIEILREQLTLRHVGLIRIAEEQAKFAANFPHEFTEENEAEFTADWIKQAQVSVKELERQRKEEKEPFLRQGQFVDGFFGELADKLVQAIKCASLPLQNYLEKKAREEQARREAEAAMMRKEQEDAMRAAANMKRDEMQAAEVTATIDHAVNMAQVAHTAEAVAAVPVSSMASTSGKFSAAGLKTVWAGEIVDWETLDLHKLRPFIARAELQKALDRFVKQGGRQCEGAKIKESMKATVK